MADDPITSDLWRCSYTFQNVDSFDAAVNVLHLLVGTPVPGPGASVADAQGMAGLMGAFWNGTAPFTLAYRDLVNTQWVLTRIVIDQVVGNLGWETDVANVAGTRAGEALPDLISVCASHSTGFGGKRRRGRTYMLPPVEGDNTDQRPSAAYLAEVTALWSDFRAGLALSSRDVEHVIYSEVGSGTPLAPVGFTNVVLNTTADAEWDTQRRRGKRQLSSGASVAVRSTVLGGPAQLTTGSYTTIVNTPAGRTSLVRTLVFTNTTAVATRADATLWEAPGPEETIWNVAIPAQSTVAFPGSIVVPPGLQLRCSTLIVVGVWAAAFGSLLFGAPE